ncbi:hypothetical protein FVER14953_21146 [Fusarium verticillioides]|nr:hypothetical protein FVER14953_21146 [Fusarium verticillioides]
MYVLRIEDAPEPGANETESSRFDGRVETAEGTSDRTVSFEEFRNELKAFEDEGKNRRSEPDNVNMVGAEDEPFNFNTVTEIIPREGYHLGTSDMEVEDPKYQEDDEDHEGPRSARSVRSANLHDSHHYPPSASGLPSQYNQYDQDTIINTYFEGVN